MGDVVYILHPEYCDLCKSKGLQVQAVYDGKTVHGPWAYMCEEHFEAMGVGLGTGRGQRLIVGEKPVAEKASYQITEVDEEDDTDETLAHSAEKADSTGAIPPPSTGSTSGKALTDESHQDPDAPIPENETLSKGLEVEVEIEGQPVRKGKVRTPHPKKLDWGNLYP